jgi:hypothetical protein
MRVLIILHLIIFSLLTNQSLVYGQQRKVDLRIRILNLKEGDYIKSNGFITFNYSVFNKGSDIIYKYDSLYIAGKLYDSLIKPRPFIIPLPKDINVNDSIVMSFSNPYTSPIDYNYFNILLDVLPLNRSANGLILENLEQQKDNRAAVNFLKYRSPTSNIKGIEFDNFNLFPNPADKIVNIKFTDVVSDAKFGIYDINGKLIKEFSFTNFKNSISINTSDFDNGVYFITVSNNQRSICSKLIIMH